MSGAFEHSGSKIGCALGRKHLHFLAHEVHQWFESAQSKPGYRVPASSSVRCVIVVLKQLGNPRLLNLQATENSRSRRCMAAICLVPRRMTVDLVHSSSWGGQYRLWRV